MRGFDYKKAVQILNYFALKESNNKLNIMKGLKLIWLCDRYHLRHYGRPILGDTYFAMKQGPVPSKTKDIAQKKWDLHKDEIEYRDKYIKTIDRYEIKSINTVDEKVFSKSDLEAIDIIYKNFGHLNNYGLADISHYYPEWKKFQKVLNEIPNTRRRMDYEDFFEEPLQSPSNIFDSSKDLIHITKELFKENFIIS